MIVNEYIGMRVAKQFGCQVDLNQISQMDMSCFMVIHEEFEKQMDKKSKANTRSK